MKWVEVEHNTVRINMNPSFPHKGIRIHTSSLWPSYPLINVTTHPDAWWFRIWKVAISWNWY